MDSLTPTICEVAPTNLRIMELKERFGLSRDTVAAICEIAPSAVDFWFSPPDSKMYRETPQRSVTLMELQLGVRKPKWNTAIRRERQKSRSAAHRKKSS